MSLEPTSPGCRCGAVHLEVEGAPIIRAECCCDSCRAAAARLAALPSAPRILEAHGGTRYEIYRKDRVRVVRGVEHLAGLRLRSESTTRRIVATCCSTPVFLEFQRGHWLSLYAGLWPVGTLPPPELRTMTVDLPPGVSLPDDIPNYRWQSFTFYVRLFGAWAAMGFRRPTVEVAGELRA